MTRPASHRFTKAQRLEVFERFGAIVCCQAAGCDNAIYIQGCPIDHFLALVDGGKHEFDNWRPICTACHAKKSAREHKENCRAKRRAKKHSGQDDPKPRRRLQGRKFPPRGLGARSWRPANSNPAHSPNAHR